MLKNFARPWTNAEMRKLLHAVDASGGNWLYVSMRLQRSPDACRRKWQRLHWQNRGRLEDFPITHKAPKRSFTWELMKGYTRITNRLRGKR
ncbi:SANT/Myb-like DNA-binding domain-containing protein [Streptomyces sp. NPDC127112]|uniref:SANT/Myb-like DNA-binding domain-containing protein n=1 Tax=Streptomyces sp. NPDC127112 TaxID=3345364 RepID=UPI00363B2D32